MVALCLSGSVLVLTFWPAVRDDHPKIMITSMAAIVMLNVLLAVGCKVIALAIVMMLLLHDLTGINYKVERYGK